MKPLVAALLPRVNRGALAALVCLMFLPNLGRAEHEGKVQILLLGDSATEASIPRKMPPRKHSSRTWSASCSPPRATCLRPM